MTFNKLVNMNKFTYQCLWSDRI